MAMERSLERRVGVHQVDLVGKGRPGRRSNVSKVQEADRKVEREWENDSQERKEGRVREGMRDDR